MWGALCQAGVVQALGRACSLLVGGWPWRQGWGCRQGWAVGGLYVTVASAARCRDISWAHFTGGHVDWKAGLLLVACGLHSPATPLPLLVPSLEPHSLPQLPLGGSLSGTQVSAASSSAPSHSLDTFPDVLVAEC